MLWRCLYAFFLLQFAYGLLFGWSRTGNIGVYHFLLGVGNVAGDMLSPLIPAIDNVPRNYYADGYGHRAEFARHVAEIGWLCAVLILMFFSPLLVKDHKFIKKQWRVSVRARARSCEWFAFWCLLGVLLMFYGVWIYFDGAIYGYEGRSGHWLALIIAIRKYDFAAAGAMWMPSISVYGVVAGFIQLWHSIRRMCFPKEKDIAVNLASGAQDDVISGGV